MTRLSFLEFAVQVRILDVHLMNLVISLCGNRQTRPNRSHLGNWSISIEEIDTRYLREPLRNQACLVMDDVPSSVPLQMENPTTANDVHTCRLVYQLPSAVRNQRNMFFFHHFLPSRPIRSTPRLS